jgi:hypothetical protein
MQRFVSGHAPSRVAAFGGWRPHFVIFVNFVVMYVLVIFVATLKERVDSSPTGDV